VAGSRIRGKAGGHPSERPMRVKFDPRRRLPVRTGVKSPENARLSHTRARTPTTRPSRMDLSFAFLSPSENRQQTQSFGTKSYQVFRFWAYRRLLGHNTVFWVTTCLPVIRPELKRLGLMACSLS
jgi:hypothetical protein